MKKFYRTLVACVAVFLCAVIPSLGGDFGLSSEQGVLAADPQSASQNEPRTIKILAIGNSFSEDAVEQNLWELFHEAGYEAVIGNMYIGGCSLERHRNNASNDAPAYSYRKIVDGVKTTKDSVRLSEALVDEQWDYITFQQNSGNSGIYSTYTPYFEELFEYVKSVAQNPDVQYAIHQTWAYAMDSNHKEFPKYSSDQLTMYHALVDAYNQVASVNGIEIIIPCGTAIQNGRNSYLGDTFNRDGYHLDKAYGRYTAACTWFERLSGIDVTTLTYCPSSVSESTAEVVRYAAHQAVLNPNDCDKMESYQIPPVTE